MYKFFIRPILFLLKPETAHHLVMSVLKIICLVPGIKAILRLLYTTGDERLQRKVFTLTFKNPVGLAAGFDKNAKYFNELACLGFGFIEIGTVTPKPQPGNPRPRLFRLSKDAALINRMGFNNDGVDKIVERLKKRTTDIIIGGNIGKNKTTPNAEAIKDYEICFEKLFDYVDYFVINVSSPNTPDLRALQDKVALTKILNCLQQRNHQKKKPKPILVKIAPELSNQQLDDIIEVVRITKINGIIATNTTLSRKGLQISPRTNEIGGLSGKPLTQCSTEVIRYLTEKSNKTLPIIGVGGIHSPEDALEKIKAGASLVQLYTGFIYEGPALVKRIYLSGFLQRIKTNSH